MTDVKKTVVIEGRTYRIDDPRVKRSYLNPDRYVHVDFNGISIRVGLTTTVHPESGLRFFSGWEYAYIDTQESDLLRVTPSINICIPGSRRPIIIYGTSVEAIIEQNHLIRGINNPDIYYLSGNINQLDIGMPYRQFNNTYKKKTVEDVVGKEVAGNISVKEYQELKASVFKENVKWGVDSATHLELEGLKPTLGFELETISGSLNAEEAANLNVAAVHDGSLRPAGGGDPQGGEYVTGVMYGDAGFAHLHELCRILQRNCTLNYQCGVHVHIGSLNWNKEDIVYCYLLAEMIEKEMYSLLPKSRAKNEYCRALTPIVRKQLESIRNSKNVSKEAYNVVIDTIYNEIFLEVSGGHYPSSEINTHTNHPRGSKCGFNKGAQRYCWLNFVTLIFDTKGNPNAKTLEIRSHSGTMSYKKIKNWTKIWVAFTNFVNKYKTSIINGVFIDKNGTKFNITLELMAKLAYPKRGDNLIDYMRERKQIFKSSDESVDYAPDVTTKKSIKECVLS